jgi:hypothetical protein
MAGNNVRIKASMDDKVSKPLTGLHAKFDALGKNKGAQAVMGGVGLGAGIGAFGLLSSAISGVTSILGDSMQAAMEEEKSVAGLDAALKANIQGWDGNRGAIEDVLKSRMRLGHSDDEQRTSLKTLLSATHDVSKALNLQRVAMDLAAFKGISLAEASTALVKVEGGQYRALKQLGIVLPQNATAMDALAAVTKVTAGAADAQANTAGGKQLAANLKIGEVMEKLGAVILPIVTRAMEIVADNVEMLSDNANVLGDVVAGLPFIGLVVQAQQAADKLKAMDVEARKLPASLSPAAAGAHSFETALTKVGDAADRNTRRVRVSLSDIVAAFKNRISEMDGLATDAGEAIYGPIDRRAELSRINREIAETQHNISSGRLRGADLADAQQKLRDLSRDQLSAIAALTANGEASQKEMTGTIKGLVAQLKGATDDARARVLLLIAAISQAAQAKANLDRGKGAAGDKGGGGKRAGARASGGPVKQGLGYLVGEHGPELFVPAASGNITNARETAAMRGGGGSAGGGSPVVIQLVLPNGRELARLVDEHLHYIRPSGSLRPA